MKKNNGLRDKRLLEAFEYIDEKFVDEAAEQIKARPKGGAHAADGSGFHRSIRLTLALAAGLLIISAFIPLVHHIINNYLNISGFTETTTDETTLSPDITSEEETTSPSPETSSPETTAEVTTEEATTAEETTAPPEETDYPPEQENNGTRGLAYSVAGNHAKFVGIGSCTEKNLEIASYYRGLPVTTIGYGALSNHTEIESITIPEGVKQIETLAFSGCTNLKSVHIPSSVYLIAGNAFDNCPALESITVAEGNEYFSGTGNCLVNRKTKTLFLGCKTTVIPDDGSVEKIAEGAFTAISGLRGLVIPEGVTTVAKGAITGCPDLEKISLPSTLATYEAGAVQKCPALAEITVSDKNETYAAKGNCLINTTLKRLVLGCAESVIPDDMGIVYIEESAFANAVSLQSIAIPEGVTTVYAHAFEGCSSLKSVKLPESLKTISDYAFFGCSALEAVEFPRNFKTIGNYAFSECTSLTYLDIGNYIESVGEAAFKNCTGLKTLVIGRLSSWSNYDVYFSKSVFEGCRALETVDVTATGLISYGEAVFKNCTSLKSFRLIETYYYVPKEMFYGCKSLSKIEFDDNLSEIRTSAFYGCSSLTSISIIGKVTEIGSEAFYDCKSLKEFIFEGNSSRWYTISKGTNWNLNAAFTAVKCLDTDVVLAEGEPEYDGSRGLEYRINKESGTATLVGFGSSNDWNKVIASHYNGYPVTEIVAEMFKGCNSLPEVKLPDTLKIIGNYAFAYCYSTDKITLPASLEVIGDRAFTGCISLAEVNFKGTVEQWNKVQKGYKWNDGCPITVVHCSDGDAQVTRLPRSDGSIGFKYNLWSSGVVTIYDIGTCTDVDLIIGTTYDGFPIVQINAGAFSDAEHIKSITVLESVDRIESSAFARCKNLETVYIPASVTSLDLSAFSDCPNLKIITIHPDNKYYFSTGKCIIYKETGELLLMLKGGTIPTDGSVTVLTEGAMMAFRDEKEIIIPEGITTLEMGCIMNMKKLESIHLPSTLTDLGDYFLDNCPNISRITVAKGNPKYTVKGNCLIDKEQGMIIFGTKDCVIPTDGSIKSIGYGALSGFTQIKNLVIPEGVVSIGAYAFSGCTSLQSIKFPESLESIGTGAFYGCTALKKVSIGDNVKYFGTEVFAGCTSLEEVSLPKEIEQWPWGIFDSCKSLRRIVVPYGVQDFDIRNCENLIEVILPETVTHASFNDCTSLRTVILPQSMTSMFDIFNGCTALEEIVLPAGLTKIYSQAFLDCVSLKKIVIKGDVTEIGAEAFKNCSSLETITLPASLTSIKSRAFKGCTSLREIIFEGSREEWEKISKGANWDTQTALAVIQCTDGKITADAQPEDYSDIEKLPEALKNVLLGKSTFRYAGTDKDMLLDDIETYWESGRLADMEHVAYAVVDMDGDGALEVVVSSYCTKGIYESNTGDKIILREYNGKVYGYHFSGSILDGDYMENIKVDGSFMWCPDNPNYDCYATISFSGSGYTITTHCKYRSFGADFEYLIGNTKVTREEFNEYIKRFAKDQVIWYDLDRYPLEKTE